jgi:pimeloyl-ACP methyl ester carboxylesterase
VIVDDLPMFHRRCDDAGHAGPVIVHIHGFGISGTYLEPTAALLAQDYRTFVPDLPGMGRSIRPAQALDLPALASALIRYLDAVGVEQAVLVGNSLGCPIIVEVAAEHPERIERAVFVSPAGGPNNRPMHRALRQMALDGLREPPTLVPIAVRDYLRFGLLQGLSLFGAMTRYPTLERLQLLAAPTLVIAGARDPLVRIDRIRILAEMPHIRAVKVPGAHALNFSAPQMIAALIDAHIKDAPLSAPDGPLGQVEVLDGPAD